MPPAYEILLLNTAVPQIQAAQSGDTYVVPRDIAFSAVANLANGTYLLPALAFSSDPDTGIFRQGANALGFTAGGGSDQMVLTTTGLGIGTSSPAFKLQVNGSGSQFALVSTTDTTSTTGILFGDSASNTVGRIEYVHSDNGMRFFTNGTAQATLDSSGNLGLGVTPSAWGTGRAIELGNVGNALWSANQVDVFATMNAYQVSGGNWRYASTNPASLFEQFNGNFYWKIAPSGTANSASVTSGASYTVVALGSSTLAQWQAFFNDSSNNPLTVTPTLGQVLTGNATGTLLGGGLVTQNISFTQAMTLDASGNLGVGETSPDTRAHIYGASTANRGQLYIQGSGTTSRFVMANSADAYSLNTYGDSSTSLLTWDTNSGYGFRWTVADTERARITSGGDLLVGRTSVPVTNTAGAAIQSTGLIITESSQSQGGLWVNRISSDGTAIQFTRDNVVVGSVSVTTTATAYNTSSDYRLKNITGPITTSGAYIDSLNPVEGTWKADGSTFVGLIAHEVQEASRTTVATGTKDGEQMQGMDYSNAELIANLIAEVKSLRARVAQLEQGA